MDILLGLSFIVIILFMWFYIWCCGKSYNGFRKPYSRGAMMGMKIRLSTLGYSKGMAYIICELYSDFNKMSSKSIGDPLPILTKRFLIGRDEHMSYDLICLKKGRVNDILNKMNEFDKGVSLKLHPDKQFKIKYRLLVVSPYEGELNEWVALIEDELPIIPRSPDDAIVRHWHRYQRDGGEW